jgi:hypothetical protein
MKPTLRTSGVWSRLTMLARKTSGFCAVPYFGSGASTLLPLRAGSCLIVKFDRQSVQAGQVNPREIVHLIKRGVEVHACANLHAKVFVFGNVAIVGSANVSDSSANHLVEACVELHSRAFAGTCEKFMQSLCGDIVGLEFAEKMIKLYNPPRVGQLLGKRLQKTKRVIPVHSGLWLVSLVSGNWAEVDYQQEDAGWSRAERALSSPRKSDIETFLWQRQSGHFINGIKRGERIVMNTREDRLTSLVSPPGRVLDIRRYRAGKRTRSIIYLEIPKTKRRRNLKSFLRALGPTAKWLGHPRRTKRVRRPELVHAIGQVFA